MYRFYGKWLQEILGNVHGSIYCAYLRGYSSRTPILPFNHRLSSMNGLHNGWETPVFFSFVAHVCLFTSCFAFFVYKASKSSNALLRHPSVSGIVICWQSPQISGGQDTLTVTPALLAITVLMSVCILSVRCHCVASAFLESCPLYSY